MRSYPLVRDRGVHRLSFLAVLAAALLGCVLPQTASAASGFALSKTDTPHAICKESSSPVDATCEAIAVPTVAASSAEAKGPELEGSGEKGGFDPKDLHEAYKLPEKGGSSSTIAIVDSFNDPYAESDLQKYREKYKVYYKGTETACTEANGCFIKVNQKGETKNYPENESLWSGEISLDLDMVSAACAECKILLVEANEEEISSLGSSDEEAEKLGASAISNSWNIGFEGSGPAEIDEANEKEFNKYFDHEQIPILFSAGDYGYSARYPAVSQYVIAVGGTKLKKEPESSRKWTEEVWSNTAYGYRAKGRGTSSGCSKYEPKPKWQIDKACTHRMQNDVAAVASPQSPVSVYDTYEGGWINLGGTSASSPFLAGVEGLSTHHSRTLKADAFYVAKSSLFDVTKGDNGTCTPPTEDEYFCTAEVGYDGPTGNGTPDNMLNLVGAPVVVTGSASSITKTGATLNGMVNPEDAETKYYFEYGETISYGKKTAEADIGSGGSNVEVNKTVTSLEPETTYHYRIVATNSIGTTDGIDQTFTTTARGWSLREPLNASKAIRNEMRGVSCPSANFCIAVGRYETATGSGVVAERWNGTEWIQQEPIQPTKAEIPELSSISCTSSTACIAVGGYRAEKGSGQTLVEQWNGTEWKILASPPSSYELHAISCWSATGCMVVGTSSSSKNLAVVWNGTEWKSLEVSSHTGAKRSLLSSVSCASAEECTVIEPYYIEKEPWLYEIQRWNGKTWKIEEIPSPKEVLEYSLQKISCPPSSSACVAVGHSKNKEHTKAWTVRWTGSEWKYEEPPRGTWEESALVGISCIASSECIAVGSGRKSTMEADSHRTLAERWNGTEWMMQEPANPSNDEGVELDTVSCTSTLTCMAVGYVDRGENTYLALGDLYE
jgi:hypothetical protein